SSVLLTSHIFSFLSSLFYIIHRRPPISPLFPYTTLFRSIPAGQIFVIGDSHIGLAEGSEKPICTWLDRFVTLQPRALYLNGDLFHYLIADPKFYTASVDKVFARFRALRDSGVEIHYIEGNRDFFLRGSFAEKSVSDVALQYTVRAGPRRYL